MHSFIQICLYQKGIRTIALEENYPPPQLWLGLVLGLRANFPREQLNCPRIAKRIKICIC